MRVIAAALFLSPITTCLAARKASSASADPHPDASASASVEDKAYAKFSGIWKDDLKTLLEKLPAPNGTTSVRSCISKDKTVPLASPPVMQSDRHFFHMIQYKDEMAIGWDVESVGFYCRKELLDKLFASAGELERPECCGGKAVLTVKGFEKYDAVIPFGYGPPRVAVTCLGADEGMECRLRSPWQMMNGQTTSSCRGDLKCTTTLHDAEIGICRPDSPYSWAD